MQRYETKEKDRKKKDYKLEFFKGNLWPRSSSTSWLILLLKFHSRQQDLDGYVGFWAGRKCLNRQPLHFPISKDQSRFLARLANRPIFRRKNKKSC